MMKSAKMMKMITKDEDDHVKSAKILFETATKKTTIMVKSVKPKMAIETTMIMVKMTSHGKVGNLDDSKVGNNDDDDKTITLMVKSPYHHQGHLH